MSGILTDTTFSRRDLLKGGGALFIGFSFAGAPSAPAAAARGDVAGPPDPTTVDTWIAVHADNTATIYLGKGEFGQGNTTGLLQIAGEELDLDMSQLRWVQLDTNVTPNQGATTSSSSIHRGGPQLRAAAAEARQALLNLASTRLGVQAGSLVVSKGVVSIDGHPSRSVSYGALLGDKPFNVKFTGIAPQKPINRYKLVGTSVPRVDIPDKASGKTCTCSTCACPTCCTAASCGRAGNVPTATAPSPCTSTRARSRTSRRGSCARATSSASSPSANGTPSKPRSSSR
jgi:nicotinate dehydrogenase subunit B